MNKTKIIKKNYEFKRIITRGSKFYGKYITVYLIKNNSYFNYLGIAVSKKTCNAVYRNKIKRLIRETYRINEENFNYGKSLIILVNRNIKIEDINYYSIKNDIENIIKKINNN